MKTKNKKYNFVSLALAGAFILGIGQKTHATTVSVDQSNVSLYSATNTAVAVNTAAKVGYFINGFSPSLANITSWDENFRSYNGYWQSSSKRFLVSMALGDNNVGGGTQTGVTGFGVTNTVGTQLYLIGSTSAYNSANNTNSVTNADYIGATSSTPVFILTDPGWIMPATTALDTTTTKFVFSTNTALAVFGGTTMGSSFSYNAGTGASTLVMIPEPSSLSLVLLGVVSVFSMRRRRPLPFGQESAKLKNTSKACLPFLLCGLACSASVQAQGTVSTPIVGFQKTALTQGYNSLGFPLVNPPILSTTTASTVSGSSISLSSTVPSSASSNSAYYLEVVSGPQEGERVDVIVNPGATSVQIAAGSSNNTSNLAGLASGTSVTIRKHLTLGDIGSAVSPAIAKNDDPNLADRVYVFSSNAFIYYYQGSDGVWVENGGLDDMSGLQINPGSGVLFYRASSTQASITLTGMVRPNKFARNYSAGYQTYGPAFPVAYSPASIGANDWAGNSDPQKSDKIIPFVSGAFLQYYLDSTDPTGNAAGTWLEVGGLDPQNSVNLVGADRLALVYRKSSDLVTEASPVR